MRKVGFILSVIVLLAIALGPAFAAAAQPFADVPRDHWAYPAIDKLTQAGVLEGYPNGQFMGKRTMTRYEFAVAIARIMNRIDQMQAGTGVKGEQGEKGEAGPVGPAGSGLTPEQSALLEKLATEFAPELKSLRSDLDALTKRVEELEANKVKPPAVTVSGGAGMRFGAYGSKLSLSENNNNSTGYPAIDFNSFDPATGTFGFNTAFGTITIPGTGVVIPISDALKDSFKANDFMATRLHVDLTATLSGSSTAYISLLASPNTNIMNPSRSISDSSGILSVSPSALSGNGIMDAVQIDQAWFKYGTKFITPVELTVGKQYLRRGQGLLFDNDQEALKGIRADFGSGSVRVGTLLAMLDPDAFFGRTAPIPFGLDQFGNSIGTYTPLIASEMYSKAAAMYGVGSNGQDQYRLVYADWEVMPGWRLGGNWLNTGFAREEGWSASLSGGLMGIDVYGEYSRLTKWPNGLKFADFNGDGIRQADEVNLTESNTAWLGGLRWGSKFVSLTGEYGIVDAGYAFAPTGGGWNAVGDGGFFNLPLSALHPRAEIDPYDINWVDRRLFLDPTNIAKGWHVGATFPTLLGEKTPVSVSYASGDGYNPDYLAWLFTGGPINGVAPEKWRSADPVWWVKLTHQMSDSVSANLLYGRREVDRIMSAGTEEVAPGVLADRDAIQVIRAEVSVQF